MRPTNIDIDCRSDLALRITTQMEHHNSSLLTGSKLRWEICRGQDACATAPALSALTRALARSKSKGVERSQRLYIQLYIFRATRPAVAPRPVNNERICTTVLQLDPRLTRNNPWYGRSSQAAIQVSSRTSDDDMPAESRTTTPFPTASVRARSRLPTDATAAAGESRDKHRSDRAPSPPAETCSCSARRPRTKANQGLVAFSAQHHPPLHDRSPTTLAHTRIIAP